MLILQGCLESNVIPEFNGSMDNASQMLTYFESQGDFFNSMDCPALIEADEVNSNLQNYLILDVRDSASFRSGHINGAISILPRDLWAYFKQNNMDKYSKVVLVSKTGQSSSYYVTLLRLYGLSNIYSLNFGMASWNDDFAAAWKDHLKNSVLMRSYTNEVTNMNSMTSLPLVSFRTKSKNIKDKVEERISDLLLQGFNEDLPTVNYSDSGPVITEDQLFNEDYLSNYYLICYGSANLYMALGRYNPYSGLGHPKGAVLYDPHSSLKSNNYLQTLPTNKKIAIYCYNGQYSASAAAYLRLLGYDAKSMLFGAYVLFYDRLEYDAMLSKFLFRKDLSNNFPYVTGN